MLTIDLKGRRALVCGASKGIGHSVAHLLAEAGARVCLLARNEEQLIQKVKNLSAREGQVHDYISADMNDLPRLKALVEKQIESGHFDILVNNSGGPPGGKLHDADNSQLTAAFAQHLLSAHELMKLLVPGMRANAYGRIINIISTSVKQPLENLGVSNTVRAAVASWSKTLASELAESGITVNNVLPGATDTDRLREIITRESAMPQRTEEDTIRIMQSQIPARRFARPDEVAAAVVFLASPLAGYVNGINLPVDGGRTKSL